VLKLYLKLCGKYIQARMQYKADFLISTATMLAGNAATVLSAYIVFQTIPRLAGWSYPQVIFIFAFAILAQSPVQILFDHLWQLRNHVNQGTFLKYYFKPIPSLVYYISEMVDLKGFGSLAFGTAALIWATLDLRLEWTLEQWLLFPVMLLSSGVIFTALMTIAASAAFWVKDSFSIMAFVSNFRDHARYPLGIYDTVIQFVFTWVVPIGFIAYYPARFFLTGGPVDVTAWGAPLLAAISALIALWVWNRGVRHWGGTGS
jgi:ABC-2 type transport system permease protein